MSCSSWCADDCGNARFVDEGRGRRSATPPAASANTGVGVLSLAQERLWFLTASSPASPHTTSRSWFVSARLGRSAAAGARASARTPQRAPDRMSRLTAGANRGRSHRAQVARLTAEDADDPRAGRSRRRGRASLPPRARTAVSATALADCPDEHLLLFVQHHLVTDGWSRGILITELGTAYRALERTEARLPPLPLSYTDLAVWQREPQSRRPRRAARLVATGAHGTSAAAGAAARPCRPRARPTRGRASRPTSAERFRADLRSRRAQQGATPFMALLAGFAALLHRPPVAMISSLACRSQGAAVFSATDRRSPREYAARSIDLSGDPLFSELVARVRAACLGAFDNQEVPFERLVEEVNLSRTSAARRLFKSSSSSGTCLSARRRSRPSSRFPRSSSLTVRRS